MKKTEKDRHPHPRWGLSFIKELETLFQEDYYNKSIKMVRISLILGIVLYAGFGLLDGFIAEEAAARIWIIRYGILCPVLISTLILTYFSFFQRIMQELLTLVSITAGLGIVAMIVVAEKADIGLLYYAGLILVLIWSATLVRLRFVFAAISTLIIILGYEFSALFIQGILSSPKLTIIFISNNFFFIGAAIISLFAAYFIEQYARNDFLQERIIAENQEEILKETNELKEKNEIFDLELSIARGIQFQLIPSSYPSENLYAFFKPMEPVGGDFFDFIKFRNEDKLGIFISDVSGHGIPAAFITSMIKSFLLESGEHRKDPAALLAHLNELLYDKTADYFITTFYGIYDYTDKTFCFANAGHNPPYRITGGEVTTISGYSTIPIAIFSDEELGEYSKEFRNNSIQLLSGDRIIFYTDGLTEAARIGTNVRFDSVIREHLLKTMGLSSRETIETLYSDLQQFRGSSQFDDDICIICMDID